eukprot:4071240-Pyramimonas_sp.AAC.1
MLGNPKSKAEECQSEPCHSWGVHFPCIVRSRALIVRRMIQDAPRWSSPKERGTRPGDVNEHEKLKERLASQTRKTDGG